MRSRPAPGLALHLIPSPQLSPANVSNDLIVCGFDDPKAAAVAKRWRKVRVLPRSCTLPCLPPRAVVPPL